MLLKLFLWEWLGCHCNAPLQSKDQIVHVSQLVPKLATIPAYLFIHSSKEKRILSKNIWQKQACGCHLQIYQNKVIVSRITLKMGQALKKHLVRTILCLKGVFFPPLLTIIKFSPQCINLNKTDSVSQEWVIIPPSSVNKPFIFCIALIPSTWK